MKVIIMAGGSGTRFWPLSTREKPKQFISLTSARTMIQETYERYRTWLPAEKIFFVTGKSYRSLIAEQFPDLTDEQVILEPAQRDTGPCVARTALHFLQQGDDEVLVFTPSDQYLSDDGQLADRLRSAEELACRDHSVVTLGFVPSRPETGYGYIESGSETLPGGVFRVKSFIEKPSLDVATQLIADRRFYWNSGIFIWKPSSIAQYMAEYQSQMWEQLVRHQADLQEIYETLSKFSVDYGIMEKLKDPRDAYVIPVQLDWQDVGFWTSLERIFPPDRAGNITIGDIHTLSTEDSILISQDKKVVAIGLRDLIVVSTENGVLISPKSSAHDIKRLIESF